MTGHPRVLLVSKPVAPPWNDSSKNLVRDLSSAMQTVEPTVLTYQSAQGPAWVPARGNARTPYPSSQHRFAPGLMQNAHVAALLAAGRGLPRVWNFFFAPNPRTSAAARLLSRLRRVKTVQTVCSQPRTWQSSDFFGDAVVALSEAAYQKLAPEHDGVARDASCHLIPPCVPVAKPLSVQERSQIRKELSLPRDEPLFIYPGDLEFGGGAKLVLEAFEQVRGAHLVMACRDKTDRAKEVRAKLRERFNGLEESGHLRWVGETKRILDFLGCSDMVLLPSSDLYGKMDLPLVLLEAMMRAIPVLVHERSAAAELSRGGGLITSGNLEELRATLQKVVEEEAWRQQLGQNLRSWALKHHSPEVCATKYESLYMDLLVA